MFRLNRRNYSLRDSPIKLAASINSPSRVQASPLKRLKLSDSSYLLSSTLLRENQVEFDEERKKIEQSKLLLKSPQKSMVVEESKQTATIDTPPPTPDNAAESKLDTLNKEKNRLMQDSMVIEEELEKELIEITMTRAEIAQVNVNKLEFDDLMEIVNKGQHEVRDQLNSIFNPGMELASKASSFAAELRQKHQRKYDKVELELNSIIERSHKTIIDKICNFEHEITLHERTLMTLKEQEKQEQQKIAALVEDQTDTKLEAATESKIVVQDKHNCNTIIQTTELIQDEDCVIVDENNSIASINSVEEVILEVGNSKTGNNDEDDDTTDIEDNQVDDTRSFTPCQAQRPE